MFMRRRDFLQLAALAAANSASPAQPGRKRIAAVSSTYFLRSHSDDLITRDLEGYWIGEKFYKPPWISCRSISTRFIPRIWRTNFP